MSLLDDFLLAGADVVDTIFGTVVMVCEGQTFNVVVSDSTRSYEGALGGLASSIQLEAIAQRPDVSNHFAMLQKRCTVDGAAYRVGQISADTVTVKFTLEDANQ